MLFSELLASYFCAHDFAAERTTACTSDFGRLLIIPGIFLTLGTPADRCKYDYEAQSEYELSYHVGDLVTVTSKEEDPWWEGIINNKKGMIYKDFVEIVKP
jgi:hypothetical protein